MAVLSNSTEKSLKVHVNCLFSSKRSVIFQTLQTDFNTIRMFHAQMQNLSHIEIYKYKPYINQVKKIVQRTLHSKIFQSCPYTARTKLRVLKET